MSSSDYGSEPEWTDPTVEGQLRQVEATSPSRTRQAPARIEVAVEGLAVPSTSRLSASPTRRASSTGATAPVRSPWEKYRKHRGWGGLSVSDLVGPSWCEVQHAYRLDSKAYLPPSQRPISIVTASGAIVPLDLQRTVARELILDKGKVVHAVLEKEVMGDVEQVKVETVGKEEMWALRLLKTMTALETLITTGRAREIPVVGFVDDFLITGVIDEVDRRDVFPPATPAGASGSSSKLPRSPSKSTRAVTPPGQSKLDAFFSPTSSAKGKGRAVSQDVAPVSRSGFVVSDTKTRYNRSLPPKEQSMSSRMQLMLYRRLISSLVSRPSCPIAVGPPTPSRESLPWPRLYAHLGINPSTRLSDTFLDQIQPVIEGSHVVEILRDASTIEDFVVALQTYGDLMGSTSMHQPFESVLEISYRLRNTVKVTKPREKTAEEVEKEDIAKAIAASLEDDEDEDEVKELTKSLATLSQETARLPFSHDHSLLAMDVDSSPTSSPLPPHLNIPNNSQATSEDPPLPRYNLRRRRPTAPAVSPAAKRQKASPPSPSVPIPVQASTSHLEGSLIGTEVFQNNDKQLDFWIRRVLKLWKGERAPEGVSAHQTSRCRTCEFESGCEWRETKSQQALANRTKTI